MNQQCKVCGEPAAGYHFGAFTCEGCKSFFGRTYNNLAALGECKNNGQCVINKKNRTSCKSCRLKKCLMVGMSKSGSRYGRRSNWFKIHCLIQDQAEMNNRLAEGTSPFTENKDLVAQYKAERPSSRTNHSSNGGSPSSSDGRAHSVPSPYASLYEAARANGFAPTYDAPSPSLPGSDSHHGGARSHRHHHTGRHESSHHRSSSSSTNHSHHKSRRGHSASMHHHGDSIEPKEQLHHGLSHLSSNSNGPGSGGGGSLGQVSPGYPFHSTMPMSPVSPLSPLSAASRFFFHHPSAPLFKGLHNLPTLPTLPNLPNLPKLYNADIMANYAAIQSRFMPLHALNPVLKTPAKPEGIATTASPGSSELLAALPEQDGPIDLSVKPSAGGNEALGLGMSPSPPGSRHTKHHQTTGDGDSGFSPSSNEENNNTSPLDLTSKRTPEPSLGIEEDEEEDDEDLANEELHQSASDHEDERDDVESAAGSPQ